MCYEGVVVYMYVVLIALYFNNVIWKVLFDITTVLHIPPSIKWHETAFGA